jgi:hypothetical protein
MEKKDKVFADGIIFKRNDNAPAFAIGKLSFKVDEAISFLQSNQKKGWVNLNINQAQSGKYYIEVDTWEATGAKPTYTKASDLNGDMANEFNNTDLPF